MCDSTWFLHIKQFNPHRHPRSWRSLPSSVVLDEAAGCRGCAAHCPAWQSGNPAFRRAPPERGLPPTLHTHEWANVRLSQGRLGVLGPGWEFLNSQPQVLGQNWCREAPAPVRAPTFSLVAQPPQRANSRGRIRASWWEDSHSCCITDAWSGHWLGHHEVLVNFAQPPIGAGSLPLALGRLGESQSPRPSFLPLPLPLENLCTHRNQGPWAGRCPGGGSQHCDRPGRDLLPLSGLGGVKCHRLVPSLLHASQGY